MVSVTKHVRRGLINRDGPAASCRVRLLSRMDLLCFESPIFVHLSASLSIFDIQRGGQRSHLRQEKISWDTLLRRLRAVAISLQSRKAPWVSTPGCWAHECAPLLITTPFQQIGSMNATRIDINRPEGVASISGL